MQNGLHSFKLEIMQLLTTTTVNSFKKPNPLAYNNN